MSLFGALAAGVSGLAAQSQAMGVISDNITNVNTVGYKNTKSEFSTLVTQTATASSYVPGGVTAVPVALPGDGRSSKRFPPSGIQGTDTESA